MAIQGHFDSIAITSSDDLSAAQYTAVDALGQTAAASENAIGLLQNKPAAAGRQAQVGYHGHMKAYAGAAITAGATVMVTTSGFIITATSAGNTCGQALTTAASGDLFDGLFSFPGHGA